MRKNVGAQHPSPNLAHVPCAGPVRRSFGVLPLKPPQLILLIVACVTHPKAWGGMTTAVQ